MSGAGDLFASEDEAREARTAADGGDPFANAAEISEKRRGRGRPKDALNRKTRDFERYYAAMGYRDPLVAWAQFLTRNPVELQDWIAEHETTYVAIGKKERKAVPSLADIIQEQHRCAERLAPYLHGKKPVQVEIIDERLPTLIVDLGTNQLDEARRLADRNALSIGAPLDAGEDPREGEKANEINDGDAPVTRKGVTRND